MSNSIDKVIVNEIKLTAHETCQKTLAALMNEQIAVKIERALLHQAFQVPYAGTETTLSDARVRGIKMVYHPMYGLICLNKDKRFFTPSANVVVAYE